MRLRAFQLVVLVVLLMVPGGHPRADLTPEQTQQAEALIAQFRAPEFAVRQQAVKGLVAMGPDVLPLVKKTLAETNDNEVKLRCEMVIKALDPGPRLHLDPLGGLEETTRKEIAALVAKFASDDTVTRKEAVARLVAIGPIVLPLVNNTAQRPKNAEVKRCCERVARGIKGARAPYGKPIALQVVPDAIDPQEQLLGDFEDGTRQGWGHNGGTTRLAVAESDRARGKRWLRVDLRKAKLWPGAWHSWRQLQDWSKYRALRFHVFNPYDEDIPLGIRADDRGNYKYDQRYNRDFGLLMKPGPNDLEVCLGSLKVGSSGSRGQNVTEMRILALFITDRGEPTTLYFDDIRLVAPVKTDAKPLVLEDFEGNRKGIWQPQGDTVFRTVKRPDGGKGSALKLDMGTDGMLPGVRFTGIEGNWLDYDLFCVDVFCPKDRDTPVSLAIRIKGKQGVEMKLTTGLKKGLNRVTGCPLELAGMVALSKVTELSLYSLSSDKKQVCYLDNMRLERRPELIEGGTVHTEGKADAPLTISFRGVDQITAAFASIVWIPLKSGQTRVIRCTTPGPGVILYALDAPMLQDRDPKKPIQIWGHYRVGLDQFWAHTEVTAEGKKPIKVEFDDPTRFAR